MSENSDGMALSIFGKDRGGRPRGSHRKPQGSRVSAWVEAAEHNSVIEQAKQSRISVSRFVAEAVREKLSRARHVRAAS